MGGGNEEPILEYNKCLNYCLKGEIMRKQPRIMFTFFNSHTAAN